MMRFMSKIITPTDHYMMIRAVIITTLLMIMYAYLMFTPNIEAASIESKEFMRCGINYCVRTYNGTIGIPFKHSRSSVSINLYLVLVSFIPLYTFLISDHLVQIVSLASVSIGYIPIFVHCNTIVLDYMIMGFETDKSHISGRYILWTMITAPVFMSSLEMIMMYVLSNMRDNTDIEDIKHE